MRVGTQAGLIAMAIALGVGSAAWAEVPSFDAQLDSYRQSAERGSQALSLQAPRLPRMAWTASGTAPRSLSPAEAARHHLEDHAARHRLPLAAVHTAEVAEVHDTGRGGIIVRFRQRADGYEVVGGRVSVLMTRDLELVAVSGQLAPQAASGLAGEARFRLAPEQAVAAALSDRYGAQVALASEGPRQAGYTAYALAPTAYASGVHLLEPARAKPVLYPLDGRLIPAYALHFIASFGPSTRIDGYEYVIAADDGALLRRQSLSAKATFTYRVWARDDAYNTPFDGPQGTANPHPVGEPADLELEFIDPIDVAMLGFNTNPDGQPDPWLPEGATETRGNNVDAYADHTLPDGFNDGRDVRATITGPGEFLHTYDPDDEPLASDEQVMASVTSLFYVTNWLHNWYYDSGFDEAAGNAQENNFGRGGEEGDRLLAEAQDGARHDDPPRNNANMLTPPDGTSPRMQMYLWLGPTDAFVEALDRELSPVGVAVFGPEDFDLEGEVVLVDDGSTEADAGEGSVTDACQPIQNDVSGAIALVDRGGCTFESKAERVQAAGAIGMIVANNEPEGVVTMAQGDEPLDIQIPALMITFDDGLELREALPASARMFRDSSAPERDGTLDNTIVAHEWGHYLHFRLVEGCGIIQQCRAMSEGFADFVALHMTIDEDTDLEGALAVGQYATASLTDNVYFGVRRVPYSIDFGKNALTFGHISRGAELPTTHPMRAGAADNAQVHNAGEVWGSALLEAYAALLHERDHEFDEARRRMSDYLVAAMKLAPPSPTYTEQARALLAAVWAADRDDFEVMAAAFARRGMGSGAESPPAFSTDLVGVVESFETAGELRLVASALDDSIDSCDGDGVLDLTETGNLVLTIENVGFAELEAATIRVTTNEPALSFPEGDTVTLDAMAPITAHTLAIPVAASEDLPDLGLVTFEVTVQSPGAVAPEQTLTLEKLVNYDVVENASRVDRVDSPVTPWTTEDFGAPSDVWRREPRGQGGVWLAEHFPAVTDSRLISPELEVSRSNPLVISFRHRHQFASAPLEEGGPLVHFGGGVVEIRVAGGEWRDVSDLAQPGYGGSIGAEGTGNPLQGRPGYISVSEGYPELSEVRLNFGSAFAGQRVQLRFRVGAGLGLGAPGWEIDEIAVSGIDNRPFHELQGEGGDCETLGTPSGGCGCASGGGSPLSSALAAALVALVLLLPRRRREARA
jgi:large repetitive protein